MVGTLERKGKSMLHGSGWSQIVSLAASLKNQLMYEADAAFQKNDRDHCVDVIERLYEIFDDEQDAY
jgi:hypothetical protein